MKMGVSFMPKPKKKKAKTLIYCKRCGVETKPHFRIELTPKKIIDVCYGCFNWSLNKTMAEIRKDYKERAKRKKDE